MASHALDVFFSGGPVMVPLAIASLFLYKTIIGLLIFVRNVSFDEITGERLGVYLSGLDRRSTPEAVQRQIEVFEEALWRFKQLVRSRLRYSHSLVIAAPLLGLLGTVMGMLDTFHGLSLQVSHETARAVSAGISRALVSTETGLLIAIPALFLIHWIKRECLRHEFRILEKKMRLLSQAET